MNALARAALAGAATGARSFTGLAALTLATPAESATQPDRSLGHRWVKGLVTLAAAQELVMDKLPQAPSRLGLAGLGARITTGAAVGTVAARRGPEPSGVTVAVAVAVAVGTTVTAAWLGANCRRLAVQRFGNDYVGAGAEDLLAMSLAWTATRA